MRIIIINASSWSWYKVGEIYEILDANKYKTGVQVVRDGAIKRPDVVAHGDYMFIV